MSEPRVLVTGAGGQLGRLVLEQLLQVGVPRIVGASRTPQKLSEFASRGVDVRAADFNAPETLDTAFRNINRLLLISTDDLFSGKRVEQHRNAIEAARRTGISHIVYTSMPDPEGSKAIPFAPDHVATEAALKESGLGYTILRVAWYAENPVALGLIPAAIRTGSWFSAAGVGKISYVTRFDVARTAAAVLARSEEENHVYDITGPQALAASELVDSLSRVIDKEIQLRQVDDLTLGHELIDSGVSAKLVPMLIATDKNTRDGHFDLATTTVRDLTGKTPKSFEQFLLENRQTLSTTSTH